MQVFIVGGNGRHGVWAKAPSLEEAKAEFDRQGGLQGKGYTILEFQDGTKVEGIDFMGTVQYEGQPPKVTEVPKR